MQPHVVFPQLLPHHRPEMTRSPDRAQVGIVAASAAQEIRNNYGQSDECAGPPTTRVGRWLAEHRAAHGELDEHEPRAGEDQVNTVAGCATPMPTSRRARTDPSAAAGWL
jgi:hypothetical protein